MARTEIYTCDICKQSKSKDDLAKITVQTSGIRMKNIYGGFTIDVCPDCLKKKGIVVEPKKSDEEDRQAMKQNEVTLKDKILDILSELDVVFAE